MIRWTIQILVNACLMILALVAMSVASTDPPKEEAKKENAEKGTGAEADEEYRREAEKLVKTMEIEIFTEDAWSKVKRIEKPLLFYGDPTRDNDRGSVWGWGEKGRPIALIELYQNVSNRARWVYAICNTSGGKIRASRGGDVWWLENESASELKDVPGAPVAAKDAPQRQRQLKQLAQKFTGHEFWDPNNSRFELRRLERPLLTYKDEEDGLLEGALYSLANGTNPEILVFLEARGNPTDGSKPTWQFAVGRLAHAELHLEYEGKEVFNAPRGNRVAGRDKPYWLGFINVLPEPRPNR